MGNTVAVGPFEKFAKDVKLKHFTTDPPPKIRAMIVEFYPKIKNDEQLIKDIYHISVKWSVEHESKPTIECILAIHDAKGKTTPAKQQEALQNIVNTYIQTGLTTTVLGGSRRDPIAKQRQTLMKTKKGGFTDPSTDPWLFVETKLAHEFYKRLTLKYMDTPDFQLIEERIVSSGFKYYRKVAPPLIEEMIVARYPKIEGDKSKIKVVYDTLILLADNTKASENIDFLNGITTVRAQGPPYSKEALTQLYDSFVPKTLKLSKINIEDAPRKLLISAAEGGWQTESDINGGAWQTATNEVVWNTRDVLYKIRHSPIFNERVKAFGAHRSDYNELLGMDDEDYYYDSVDSAVQGYVGQPVQGQGYGYGGAVRRGYIGNIGPSENDSGYFADPTILLLVTLSMCVCVCMVLGVFVSCAVGYVFGRYKVGLGMGSAKGTDREYESDRV